MGFKCQVFALNSRGRNSCRICPGSHSSGKKVESFPRCINLCGFNTLIFHPRAVCRGRWRRTHPRGAASSSPLPPTALQWSGGSKLRPVRRQASGQEESLQHRSPVRSGANSTTPFSFRKSPACCNDAVCDSVLKIL